MDILQSFILGLLQGITEFLPISSSGHLALAKILFHQPPEQGITFEVVVHFGTLCSIFVYYRKELLEILRSLLGLVLEPGEFSNKVRNDQNVKLSGFIILSMIPAMIVGLALESQIEELFGNPSVVSVMLLVTGTILFLTRFQKHNDRPLNTSRTFMMGVAQAFAIIPGISRSGSTISTGLYLGLNRKEAANFSFLMVIPVIGGAMLLKTIDMVEVGVQAAQLWDLLVGFLTSFISGYFALKYLIILLQKRGFHYFAYYCWAIGLIGLFYFQFG